MRHFKLMIGAAAVGSMAAAAAATTGGCQLIAGVEDAVPYPPDGGTGGTGGSETSCTPGATRACYSGASATKGVGICQAGKQACREDGGGYEEACVGEVTPKAESCAATADENCDGFDCVQWAELFGDSQGQFVTGIALDSHDNIYVTGIFYGAIPFGNKTLISAGETDIFVLKLDPSGKPIWGEQFGDEALQDGSLIAVDSSGNVFIAGRSSTPINLGGAPVPAGLFIAKLDSDGKHTWSKALTTTTTCSGGDSNILGLATTPQGDIVLGGYYCGTIDFGEGAISSNGGSRDGFIAKLNGDDGSVKPADKTWGRVLGDTESQEINGVAVDPAGNVLVAGTFKGTISFKAGDSFTSKGGTDAFVAKFTAAGLPSWRVQFGDGADQSISTIAVDSLGGPVVAGSFKGTVNFGGGDVTKGTSFIAKYESDGSYTWSKVITTMAATTGVAMDAAGNAVIAGLFFGSIDLGETPLNAAGPGLETFAAKLTATGALLWNRRFGEDKDVLGAGASVAITAAGEPILAGRVAGPIDFGTGILTSAGDVDIFVAKLSP